MRSAWQSLLDGSRTHYLVGCDHLPEKPLILSGSFNPIHEGHRSLLQAAESCSGRSGMLELSILNVDKEPLHRAEMERRLEAMTAFRPAVVTKAATFREKVELFPGSWFVLGYDTAVRLLNPAYGSDIPAMLCRFQELGSRFVIGGRLMEQAFQEMPQLEMPEGYKELFIPLSEKQFRVDLSSTQLREDET